MLDLVLCGEGVLGWTRPAGAAGEGPLRNPEEVPWAQAQPAGLRRNERGGAGGGRGPGAEAGWTYRLKAAQDHEGGEWGLASRPLPRRVPLKPRRWGGPEPVGMSLYLGHTG